MTKIRRLFGSISLLNLLLIAFIAMMVSYAVFPLVNVNLTSSLPFAGKHAIAKKESPVGEHLLSPSDFTVIADANLFHPERKIPPEKKEEPPPLPKPDLILYGTVITDNTSLAYLEDLKTPRNTPGRGKRQIPFKKGDVLSGFTLKDIEADKIVLVRGDEQMTVYVRDPQRPKPRGTVSSQAAQPPPPTAASPLSKLPSSEPAVRNAPLKQKDEKVLSILDRIRTKR